MLNKLSFILRAAVILAVFTVPMAHAATYYWDANGATTGQTDGAGVWLTANQWWDGTTSTSDVTWVSGSDAVFGFGGAGGAVTLASPTTVNSFTFNAFTGTYTLGTSGQAITLNSGITNNSAAGAVTLSSALTLSGAQSWTNNSTGSISPSSGVSLSGNLTLGGTGNFNFDSATAGAGISGTGDLIKNGTGQLIFSTTNNPTYSFTGNIILNGGYIGEQTNTFLSGRNMKITGGNLGGRFGSGFTWTGGLGTGANQIQITGGVSGLSGEGTSTSAWQIGASLSALKWGATGENGATGLFNPSVFIANGAERMNNNGVGSLNNGIDLNGTTRTITSLQTTAGASNSGFTISGALVNTAGTAAGLTKTGVGNLILPAVNTYNGDTTISSVAFNTATSGGGSITLSGSGTINSTTGLRLNGTGTLRLINTAQVDRFADSAAITSNGGFISYENTSGTNVYTETLGSLAANSGQTNFVLATNQSGTGSQTLTLGGLTPSGAGSVTFSAATTGPQSSGNKNMVVVTGGGTTPAGQIIGSWATTGTAANALTDYAVYNTNYVTSAGIAASAQSAWSTDNTAATGTLNNASSALLSATLSATRNINSFRSINTAVTVTASSANITLTGHALAVGDVVTFSAATIPTGLTAGTPYYVVSTAANTIQVSATSGGAAITPTTAGATVVANSGIQVASTKNLGTTGILNGSATMLNIVQSGGAGAVTLPTTSSGKLYVTTGSGAITINAPITNNTGALTLVKNGSAGSVSNGNVVTTGTLVLNGVNTYTGDTAINAGVLQIGTNNVANGAKLGSSGTYSGNIFIAGGAQLYISTDAAQTLSGAITGDGSLMKSYTGTLTLSGSNTYTGRTYIQPSTVAGAGIVEVSSFDYVTSGSWSNHGLGSSLGAPTTVTNGTIVIGGPFNNVQGSAVLRYTSTGAGTATGETTDRVIDFFFGANTTRTLETNGAGLLKFTSTPISSGGTIGGTLQLQGTGNGEIVGGLPIAGAYNFQKAGVGTWTLGGLLGFSGTTTISAGTLELNGNGTFNGGSYSNTIANTGTLKYNSTQNQLLGGIISGAGALIKANISSLTLAAANTYTGNTTVTGGTLNITGTITGNTTASTLALGTTAANTVVNVSNNMTLFAVTGAAVANSNAVYNQTAGTVNVSGASLGSSAGYTYTNLTGGTFKVNATTILMASGTGTGVAYLGGTGTLDLSGATTNGGVAFGGAGSLTVGPGGTVTRGAAANNFYLTAFTNGYGAINVAGGNLDLGTAGILRVGNGSGQTAMTDFVNLAGGTLTMGVPWTPLGASANFYNNYAGGTLKASANLTNPVSSGSGVTAVSTIFGAITNNNNVNTAFNTQIGATSNFTGGLTIDTNGNSVTYGNALLGATGNGVSQGNITVTGGSGYIGAPLVQFTGGTLATNGAPASGYAVISGGAVTGIVITSPGEYTVDPTVTLTGGGGTGASVALSGLNANAVDTGLTVQDTGTGSLTLTAVNTYSGVTKVNSGATLALGNGTTGSDGTIAGTSGITNNGTLIYNRFGSLSSAVAISGTGAVTKLGAGSQTLTAANTYSGPTLVSAGTLVAGNSTGSATGTGTVTVDAGTLASATTGGSIAGPVMGGSGAHVFAPGGVGTIGNFSLGSTLTLNANSTVNFDINGTTSDLLAVTGVLSATGTPAITLATTGSLTASAYILATFANSAVTSSSFVLPTAPSGYTWSVNPTSIQLTQAVTTSPSQTFTLNSPAATVSAHASSTVGVNGTLTNTGGGNLAVSLSSTGTLTVGSLSSSSNPVVSGTPATVTGSIATGTAAGPQSWQVTNTDSNATPTTATIGGTVNVYNFAAASALTSSVNLGTVHQGGTFGTQAVTVSNTAPVDATYTETLSATGAASGQASTSGTVSALAGGGTDSTSLLVGLGGNANTGAAGTVTGSVAVALNSNAVNGSGLGTTALTTQNVTVTGTVYSGQGIWNVNTSGSWNSAANWQTAGGIPGLDAAFTSTDTATFDAAATSVNPVVTLDGVSPSLKGVTFNNATQSYTIAQGTGGTLTLNGGASPATVDVTNGSHTISAPLTLATNTNIMLANAGSLTLSGAQAWSGHNVAVSGAGTITISGAQTNTSPATFTVNSGVTANINTDGGTGLSLVNGGVTNFKSSQTLAGVTINNGAHVNVTTNTAQPVATGPSVLVTPTLSIASHVVGSDAIWDGYLDLANNKLVVQTGGLSGTALQAAVQQVASQVKSGYNLANGSGTLWMGTGIGSSSAAADTRRIVGLAVFQNNTKSFGSVDGTVSDGTGNAFITTPFGGATVAKNDTLVKFTYFGDTDLDGVITAGDYANIDLAFAHQQTLGPQSGWANGDFDYDGSITAADYSLMDSAFAAQSGALAEGVHTLGGSLSGSLGSVTAVPEPSTWLLGVLGIIGLLAMARRRRMQIAK